ncbi:RNA polymerase sigma factor [Flavonifractor hominis]|uniref:Sigma-70 family RNA polymerase sigma factor n=1 Tax=Flavonifractor hominis TaxID=3133178 RepID=A0ABV1ERH2_9FIRM
MGERERELYEQHAQAVYRYLFSLCTQADLAEELTQETFCQALRQLDRFRGECSPQVWLCAIAKRLWYKELERRRKTVTLDRQTWEELPGEERPEDDLQRREERLALYRAMQHLDAETREVIHLRLAGEFSFRDIGEILGQSEAWARVRFYRGKGKLMQLLGGKKDE